MPDFSLRRSSTAWASSTRPATSDASAARSVALRWLAPAAKAASVVAASRTRAWNSGCQMLVRVSTTWR